MVVDMRDDGGRRRFRDVILLLAVILGNCWTVCCVDGDDYSQTGNSALLPLVTDIIYGQFSNLTTIFRPEINARLGFCIKDIDAEWNGAFNFTGKLDFLTNCIKQTKGDLTQRLCTAAEIKFYFTSFFENSLTSANYLRLNRNCNLTSWASGCEPGWGCSVNVNQKADLKNAKDMPARTRDCQPCCEGFFCPQGITCMIPCPLGSYCPQGKLNKTLGVCEPYRYQLPPGQPNHTCGGADIWADATSSEEIFCSPGSYCPTTVKKVPCSSGHYCRTGSTAERRCFKLTTCNANTANQNIHAYGIMLLVALCTLLVVIYNCSDQVLSTRERRAAKSREAAARHARETAQARERWKSAKNVAKKGATGLTQQLSRTFSRRKSLRQQDPPQVFGQSKGDTSSDMLPPPPGSASAQKDKKNEPSALAKAFRAIDEDP